jgi:DNA ligase-1
LGTKFNFAAKGMEYVAARLLRCSLVEAATYFEEKGDWGDVIALGTWTGSTDYEIDEVYADLERLEGISGSGSFDAKISFLVQMLACIDPLSAGYVVRIVMQNLRLGFSDMTLIEAFSWMLQGDKKAKAAIEHAYNLVADIGKIAELLLVGGLPALENISIEVGVPIRPAAAERLMTAEDIITKIGTCLVQPKYDGFRLQIHSSIDANGQHRIKFFSRNLLDMSSMFPDLIQAFASLPLREIICEGEALAYDEVTGAYLPFQETVKRKRKHQVDMFASEMPLRLVLFDILYRDGISYLQMPLVQRYQVLQESLAASTSTALVVADQVVCENAYELESYFLSCIGDGLEGVMAKRIHGIYQPGKRNFNWIKLKRIERGVLDDTIDAVILGYYFGQGRRSAFGIGALLVGVYNQAHDRFESIAKIGTGLKDHEWVAIKQQCDADKITDQQIDVVVASGLVPDVWVRPRIVVVVRADEITRSPIHTAGATEERLGLALRFPRFMALRQDKSAVDATTVAEISQMFEQQKQVAGV